MNIIRRVDLGSNKLDNLTFIDTNKPVATSLLNTKLDCRKPDGSVDEELSRAFQEACFEQGIVWAGRDSTSKTVQALSKNFLYSTECGLCYGVQLPTFEGSEERQINFKYFRKLEWEATEVPTQVDEMVDICGVEYSAKELSEALALIKAARKG